MHLSKASQDWPSVEGEIIHSRIKRTRSRGSRGGDAFMPEIKYSYSISGDNYLGDRVSFAKTKLASTHKYAKTIRNK